MYAILLHIQNVLNNNNDDDNDNNDDNNDNDICFIISLLSSYGK